MEKEKANENFDIDNVQELMEEANTEIVAINEIELFLYRGDERMNKGTETVISISEDDASKILEMLKADDKRNNKAQWNSKRSTDVLSLIATTASMKTLRDVEIRIIVRYINGTKVTKAIKESSSKQAKLSEL
ncbi:hypothetical protein MAR_021678 [Mya arenaria]|uniref:Uncharacterized protein n=1 Tax=Mya arenaria TaxID=6604 RepID=A0ABY7EB16_MYAAR|nr:hypothetical protein MAR_021678 [Mya arenaria]